MSSHLSRLSTLSRPGLLVRAARHRTVDFKRERSLRRVLPGEVIPAPGRAFETLLEREEAMNSARDEGDASYSVVRHVELLAALIHEAQIVELRIAA